MAEQGAESADQARSILLSVKIEEKFACLSHTPSNPCFFKVHDRLRMENNKAYEPEILSIGPYHREKHNVQAMEGYKLRYLKYLLQRRVGTSVQKRVLLQKMVEAMRGSLKEARECYADIPSPLDQDDDKFVEMMLLDGCFIIQLFRMHPAEHDPIFKLKQFSGSIERDLLLFENQLPFFILVRLFELIEPSLSQEILSKRALNFFPDMPLHPQTEPSNSQSNITDMVLRLFREMLAKVRSVLSTITSARPSPEDSEPLPSPSPENSEIYHLLSLKHDSFLPELCERETRGNDKLEVIKCTTELVEFGIKFEKAKENTHLLDIKFNYRNGVMEIPPLSIDDNTECLFRNLIAYEQYRCGSRRVTNYCIFMDRLINSAKDAQELRQRGIIKNFLGDDEVISKMFNKMGNNVYLSQNFCYSQVCEHVNDYCKKPLKKWWANLMLKYFNSPWSSLSVVAAIFLLLLTVIQTIFATLPYV